MIRLPTPANDPMPGPDAFAAGRARGIALARSLGPAALAPAEVAAALHEPHLAELALWHLAMEASALLLTKDCGTIALFPPDAPTG